jgi:hypothetical protein
MNTEQPSSPGPVHAIVGQLRGLLAKVPQGAWGPQHNNYGVGVLIRQLDHFVNVCWWDCENTDEHTEDCRGLIVAAVNALPALLAIAEAADQWDRATDYESKEAHLSRLHRTLRLLPNSGLDGLTPPQQS